MPPTAPARPSGTARPLRGTTGRLAARAGPVMLAIAVQSVANPVFHGALGLTLPAAKSRVQRARKRLKAQLVTACQVRLDEAGKVCCFVPRPPLER